MGAIDKKQSSKDIVDNLSTNTNTGEPASRENTGDQAAVSKSVLDLGSAFAFLNLVLPFFTSNLATSKQADNSLTWAGMINLLPSGFIPGEDNVFAVSAPENAGMCACSTNNAGVEISNAGNLNKLYSAAKSTFSKGNWSSSNYMGHIDGDTENLFALLQPFSALQELKEHLSALTVETVRAKGEVVENAYKKVVETSNQEWPESLSELRNDLNTIREIAPVSTSIADFLNKLEEKNLNLVELIQRLDNVLDNEFKKLEQSSKDYFCAKYDKMYEQAVKDFDTSFINHIKATLDSDQPGGVIIPLLHGGTHDKHKNVGHWVYAGITKDSSGKFKVCFGNSMGSILGYGNLIKYLDYVAYMLNDQQSYEPCTILVPEDRPVQLAKPLRDGLSPLALTATDNVCGKVLPHMVAAVAEFAQNGQSEHLAELHDSLKLKPGNTPWPLNGELSNKAANIISSNNIKVMNINEGAVAWSLFDKLAPIADSALSKVKLIELPSTVNSIAKWQDEQIVYVKDYLAKKRLHTQEERLHTQEELDALSVEQLDQYSLEIAQRESIIDINSKIVESLSDLYSTTDLEVRKACVLKLINYLKVLDNDKIIADNNLLAEDQYCAIFRGIYAVIKQESSVNNSGLMVLFDQSVDSNIDHLLTMECINQLLAGIQQHLLDKQSDINKNKSKHYDQLIKISQQGMGNRH